jgi:hypothetical protein
LDAVFDGGMSLWFDIPNACLSGVEMPEQVSLIVPFEPRRSTPQDTPGRSNDNSFGTGSAQAKYRRPRM